MKTCPREIRSARFHREGVTRESLAEPDDSRRKEQHCKSALAKRTGRQLSFRAVTTSPDLSPSAARRAWTALAAIVAVCFFVTGTVRAANEEPVTVGGVDAVMWSSQAIAG